MSNASGVSSGCSSSRGGRIDGIPRRCWCEEEIVVKLSKSEANPHRRYFRCSFAAKNKLMNDKHVFKWVDEAMMNEIETLEDKIAKIERAVKEIDIAKLDYEKMVYEKVLLKVEKEVFERVEEVLVEAKSEMKKMMLIVVVGCMVIVGCIRQL